MVAGSQAESFPSLSCLLPDWLQPRVNRNGNQSLYLSLISFRGLFPSLKRQMETCVWREDVGHSAPCCPANPGKLGQGAPQRAERGERVRLRADTQRCWLKEARAWLGRLSRHCFPRRRWWEFGHLGGRKEGRKQAELGPALNLPLLWSSEVSTWLKDLTVGQLSELLGFSEGLRSMEVG